MKTNPLKRRAQVQQDDKHKRVVEMYIRENKTQMEIASEMGISQPTVSQWINKALDKYRHELVQNLDEHLTRELQTLAEVEAAAWLGWNRSLQDAESETLKVGGKNGDSVESTRRGQTGDPRFLDQIVKVRERRAKLLGLDAPSRVQLEAGQSLIDAASWLTTAMRLMFEMGATPEMVSRWREAMAKEAECERVDQ